MYVFRNSIAAASLGVMRSPSAFLAHPPAMRRVSAIEISLMVFVIKCYSVSVMFILSIG